MIVVVGIGQLGGVFARGLLRLGHPVVPVVRRTPAREVAAAFPSPRLVLVAVGDQDLDGVLAGLPAEWRDRVALVQNELLPADWRGHDLVAPTVMSVWFEKRAAFEARVLRPSPVFGPQAPLLVEALATLDLPAEVLRDEAALTTELVIKNVWILAKNVAGLAVGGTGRTLWAEHAALAEALVEDALTVQQARAGASFDRDRVRVGVRAGFDGGSEQANLGRSAPARLARALAIADRHRLPVATFRRVAAQRGDGG